VTAARVGILVVAAAYAGILATTRPFTVPADVVTSLGLAVGAGALVFGLTVGRAAGAAGARPAEVIEAGTTGGTAIPWVVLVVVVVGWELYCFFGGPRPAHPTLSSVYDIVARWQAAKAVVVLAWLALGWELAR
jgi:ABC-type dipeptide/oligopeptide/nickel transport system permease subunit